ncbi:MAG: lipopolysaccharide kinase InaA family protein [Thermodesulfobacteriota bacterium]
MTSKNPVAGDETVDMNVTGIHISGYSGILLVVFNFPEMVEGLGQFFKENWSEGTMVARSKDREVHCYTINRDLVIYLKRYYVEGIKPFLRTALRLNKAQKAWRVGRRLKRMGLDTPLPIALFNHGASRFSSEFVCVTKGLGDAIDLHDAVLQVQGKDPSQQRKKQDLIKAAARFVARLHSHNIYHGDFSADNILVRGIGDAQEIRIYLIDLDAVRTSFLISERRRIKNLEELGRNFLDLRTISIAHRIRFLKVYLKHYTRNRDSLHTLFRKVRKRTEERLAKYNQSFNK